MMTVSLRAAHNEEGFLPNLLIDLEKQKYPLESTEIVLIGGKSSDKTKLNIGYPVKARRSS